MPFLPSVAVILQVFLTAHAGLVGRIINGQHTSTSEHLHQVSLQYDFNGYHFCGGSVIAENWVVTAAHCTVGKQIDVLKVVVDRSSSHDEYMISSITQHPSFIYGISPEGFIPNDISLIKTVTAIKDFAQFSIPLPTGDDTFVGDNCTITGWGTVSDMSSPDNLQETWGVILNDADCSEQMLQSTGIAGYNHIHHICIHNENTGACQGDSGGPMVCNDTLAGIASFVLEGCLTDFASTYVRVSSYTDWIKTVTGI